MKILFLFTLVVLAGVFSINDAFAVKTISDDSTGGDCSTIGTWDSASSTCILSSEITDGVEIGANYITLDGNGHTISGPVGIIINSKFDVTVKNSNVQNGIDITGSKDITITKNTVTSQSNAIAMSFSNTIKISENTITNSQIGIHLGSNVEYIEISNNQITRNGYGIYGVGGGAGRTILENTISDNRNSGIYNIEATITKNTISNNGVDGITSSGRIISENTISNNGGYGIREGSGVISKNIISGNKNYAISGNNNSDNPVFENLIESNTYGLTSVYNAYNNNLINNGLSNSVSSGQSGNYWSDYSPKCTDSNYDNFCDKPYPLGSGTSNINDNYVWKLKSGWLTKFSVPNSITLDATDSTGTPYTFTASATSEGKSLSVVCNPSSGSILPIGKTDIICTAENGVHGKFTITVNKSTPIPTDTDGDGISDSSDSCPTQDETVNGFDDLDGCPDVVPSTDTPTPTVKILMDKTTFTYGEKLFYTIQISEITGESAIIHIRNQAGKSSSAIQIPVYKLQNPIPSMVPFEAEIFPVGKYFIDVEYAGAKDSAEFDLIDSGNNDVNDTTPPTTDDLPYEITIKAALGSGSPGCEETVKGCYLPNVASVTMGGKVIFSNTDTAAHTFTAGTPAQGPSGAFDTSIVIAGSSYEWTPTTEGGYDYFCMLHPWMAGTIFVGEGTYIPPQPEDDFDLQIIMGNQVYDLLDTATINFSIDGTSTPQNVALEISDPRGTTVISRSFMVDSQGVSFEFRIDENFKTGTYKVVATTSNNGNTVSNTAYFKVISQYNSFKITSVQVTDQQGNTSNLQAGEMGFIKVNLEANKAITTLVTVNLFDSDLTSIGIGSIKTTLSSGNSEIILSFMIPSDVAVGSSNIYVNAFSDWPSNGGIPLTGEISVTENIE